MSTISLAVVRSTRPAFLLLTPVCVLLGIAAAIHFHGEISIKLAALVMVGAISAHIAANTFNEYFDFTSGLDSLTNKTPFSGGSGALPEQPHAQFWVLAAACASLALTIAIGIALVSIAGSTLLILGLIGVITILAYTRILNRQPWLCLIAPGLGFGPLMVLGTYISVTAPELVTAKHIAHVLLLSLVPFCVVNNLLLLNQLPDIEADRKVGRRTFPIRYGVTASLQVYRIFLFLAGAAVALAVFVSVAPWYAVITLLPLALGYSAYRGIQQQTKISIPDMLPFLGKNVATALLAPALYAITLLINI
jgi:1,4-dihydroxy-2-naphthoate octaprenyltransferase